MNNDMIKLLMPRQYYLIQNDRCPICGQKIDHSKLKDDYLIEFNISGMCKECQDRIFND